MKAVPGLIVAVILGGAAVVFNWIYLEKKASDYDMVPFLGIRDGVKVSVGETLLKEHFEKVDVPKKYADRLRKYVFVYDNIETVNGIKATRDYEEGDLVHREDYKTPAKTVKLGKDQRLIWIAVDSRAFVPSLVNPGDQLDFVFPDAGGSQGAESTAEVLGPFTVGALGTRLGDVDVARGRSSGRAEERQIGIIVTSEGGKVDPMALRLLELTTGSNRTVAVALRPVTKTIDHRLFDFPV